MPSLHLESIVGDVRFAFRHHSRRPLASITIVLVLAIGIGFNAALFTIVRSLTTRSAPGVASRDDVVRIRGTERPPLSGRIMSRGFSVPEYRAVAARTDQFASVAAWVDGDVVVDPRAGATHPFAARAQFVDGDYFGILGVRPEMGADLTRAGAPGGAELVAVIGHSIWRDFLASDSGAVGRAITVNGAPVTIVGVAPERFGGATRGPSRPTLWMPLRARVAMGHGSAFANLSRDSMFLSAVARLKPGVAVRDADAAVRSVSAAELASLRAAERGRSADVVPLRGDTDLPKSDDLLVVTVVFGTIASLVLLVACTNASGILVGLGVARQHEIGVRLSLGAARGRIVRQLLTESAILAVAAAGIGVLAYTASVSVLRSKLPAVELAPDAMTVLYAVVLGVVVGILSGLSPALHGTRRSLAETLQSRSGGVSARSRLQRGFVAAQIALTQPLLVGLVVLLAATLRGASGTAVNPVEEQVLSLRFSQGHRYTTQKGVAYTDPNAAALLALRDEFAAHSAVVAVTPTSSGYRLAQFAPYPGEAGASGVRPRARVHTVAPGHFPLMGIAVVRGRDFAVEDTVAQSRSVIIGERFAREVWGTTDVVGKRLVDPGSRSPGEVAAHVVGVIDDSKIRSTGDDRFPVYEARRSGRAGSGMLIRTAGPAEGFAPMVRRAAQSRVPNLAITELATLGQLEREQRAEAIQASTGAAAAGVLALLLAAIGLYGVVSVAIEQRRREVGIRVALGALPRQILTHFIGGGLRLAGVGLLLGLPLSLLALRFVVQELGVTAPGAPLVAGSIAITVLGVAALATWIPAGRATNVDPLVALRSD